MTTGQILQWFVVGDIAGWLIILWLFSILYDGGKR